jgi:hypothetical protein
MTHVSLRQLDMDSAASGVRSGTEAAGVSCMLEAYICWVYLVSRGPMGSTMPSILLLSRTPPAHPRGDVHEETCKQLYGRYPLDSDNALK